MLNEIQPEQAVVGGGLLAAMIYKIWQIIKTDRRQDRSAEAEDGFRDDLLKELTELRTELKKAHVEQLASVKREAELSMKVEVLSRQVESLISRVSELQGLLEDCKVKMQESCEACKYKQRIDEACGNCKHKN